MRYKIMSTIENITNPLIDKALYPRRIQRAACSGYCGGVARATALAYKLLDEWPERSKREKGSRELCMLGELIHNTQVINDLTSRGMKLRKDVHEVPANATVLVRAHGLPPQEYSVLVEKDCVVEDATCAYVKKIQRLASKAVEDGKKVLITGDKNHPEVVGIVGAAEMQATVISTADEIENLQFTDDSYVLVSQTTFSVAEYQRICEQIKKKIASLQIFVTICGATENRQNAALDLASEVDVMLVIGSEHSSNTKKLLEVCASVCGENYLLETPDQVRKLLADGLLQDKSVGVTAGASSPESIIMEVIHIMSENEVLNNQNEQTDQGDISFTDAIDSIPQLKRGATVIGVIVRYDTENVYVDVRDKSEGRIPLHEFTNNPDFNLDEAVENHEEIDVYVRSIRNTDMGKEIILSKARVDFGKYKALVEEAYNEKTPIVVKVANVVKDGVIASYGGVDIYIHRTQLELGPVQDLTPYADQELEILVTQYDAEKRRLRVSGSRRALLNRDRKKKAEELWSTIEVGDVYEGVVRSLTDFGAFVDIGGVDGLVHISELSWKRIKHPSEIVKVGDVVQVYIKEFDPVSKRIKLGYKRIEDDPYHNIEERFPVGSVVHGKVMRMVNYGVFIEIGEGIDAFCHISQISSMRLNKPDEVLTEGMEVDARVIDVKNGEHRIGISIKEVAPIDTRVESAEGDEPQAKKSRRDDDALPTSYSDADQSSTVADAIALEKASDEGIADAPAQVPADDEVTEVASEVAPGTDVDDAPAQVPADDEVTEVNESTTEPEIADEATGEVVSDETAPQAEEVSGEVVSDEIAPFAEEVAETVGEIASVENPSDSIGEVHETLNMDPSTEESFDGPPAVEPFPAVTPDLKEDAETVTEDEKKDEEEA